MFFLTYLQLEENKSNVKFTAQIQQTKYLVQLVHTCTTTSGGQVDIKYMLYKIITIQRLLNGVS